MEFQEKIAKYTGHQLNSLADVQAILAVAGKMDHGHVPAFTITSEHTKITMELKVLGCAITVKQGEWLLYRPAPVSGMIGALYTLSQEQMDERYEAVPKPQPVKTGGFNSAAEAIADWELRYGNKGGNLGGILNDQIRQQRERDAGVAVYGANGVRQAVYETDEERDKRLGIKRRPVYNAQNHPNSQWGKL